MVGFSYKLKIGFGFESKFFGVIFNFDIKCRQRDFWNLFNLLILGLECLGSVSSPTWGFSNPLLSSKSFNGQVIRHCKIPSFIFPFDAIPFFIKHFYRKKLFLCLVIGTFPYDLNRSGEAEKLQESQREIHFSRVCDKDTHVGKKNSWSNSNSCTIYFICLF